MPKPSFSKSPAFSKLPAISRSPTSEQLRQLGSPFINCACGEIGEVFYQKQGSPGVLWCPNCGAKAYDCFCPTCQEWYQFSQSWPDFSQVVDVAHGKWFCDQCNSWNTGLDQAEDNVGTVRRGVRFFKQPVKYFWYLIILLIGAAVWLIASYWQGQIL